MGRTKDLLMQMNEAELNNLEIIYEVIQPIDNSSKCDDSQL